MVLGMDSELGNGEASLMLSLAAALPVILVLVLWVLLVVKRGKEFKQLIASGVETPALVVERRTFNRKSGRSRALTYEFTDPTGTTRRRRAFVTSKVFEASPEGTAVTVVYLPEKPSVSALKGDVELLKKNL
jgi:hypothetical protein